jgi:hypothetical protein
MIRSPQTNIPYGDVFRKQLLLETFEEKTIDKLYELEDNLQEIKDSLLRSNIILLPPCLQNKIYIFSMRNYWKKDTIHRNRLPMYTKHYQYVVKETQKCFIDNVHFLHLEFNTLPENKQYIMGCQCEFCKYYKEENISEYLFHVTEYLNNFFHFYKHINCTDLKNIWNDRYTNDSDDLGYARIFDPLYDLTIEDFKSIVNFSKNY